MSLRGLLSITVAIGLTAVAALAWGESLNGPIEAVKPNGQITVAGRTFQVTSRTEITTPDHRPASPAELQPGIQVDAELSQGARGLEATSITANLLR